MTRPAAFLSAARLPSLLLAVALLPASAAADVLLVDDDGPADHATVQAAIDDATAGAIVLVRAGPYPGFILDGKALTIAGLGPATTSVRTSGPSFVRNIAAGEQVLLTGLDLRGVDGEATAPLGHGLVLRASAGALRVQHCLVFGGDLGSPFDAADGGRTAGPADGGTNGGPGAAAISIDNCDDVVLIDVGCEGAIGPGSLTGPGGVGGTGLHISRSHVTTFDCNLFGGFGGSAHPAGTDVGGRGGVGVKVTRHSTLVSLGGAITGGWGGWSGEFGLQSTGGTALEVESDALARLRDTELTGGFGSFDVGCTCNGPMGATFVGPGPLIAVPGVPPAFTALPAVAAPGSLLTLGGDAPLLVLAGLETLSEYVPAAQGSLFVAPPWIGDGLLLPSLPADVAVPGPLGLDGLVLHLQAYGADGLGQAASLVLLETLP